MNTLATHVAQRTVIGDQINPVRIVEAVNYLNQCRAGGRSFAVLTSDHPERLCEVLERFVAALPSALAVARTPGPTDSRQTFLETLLIQFGFEPFEATVDDLQRLLTVVLRQAAGGRGAAVLAVEDVPSFGPHVIETIRDLGRTALAWQQRPLIVLTGTAAGLRRVLDSIGMAVVADLTREHFDLDALADPATPGLEPHPAAVEEFVTARGALIFNSGAAPMARVAIDRARILIGRAEHNDLVLPGRFVSRQHALVLCDAQGVWLIDLKSTNGTIVNSRLVTRHPLADGDVIDLGTHRLRYEAHDISGYSSVVAGGPAEDLSETVIMRSRASLHDAPPFPRPAGRPASAA